MGGKCRPGLRRKTLKELELCVKLHQISITDYECVKAVFEKLEEYENVGEASDMALDDDTRIPVSYCCPRCRAIMRANRGDDVCPMCKAVMREVSMEVW